MARGWMWCLGNTGSHSALTPKVNMHPIDEWKSLSVRSLQCLKLERLLLLSGCAGRYIRSNLNMPSSLPSRGGGHRDYDKDCPITVFGSTQARLVGQFIFILYVTFSIPPPINYWKILLKKKINALLCLFWPSVGEALLESHTTIDFVYCSPSLRCVQTAHNILQGRTSVLCIPVFILGIVVCKSFKWFGFAM